MKSVADPVLFQRANIIHKSDDCIIMVDAYPILSDGVITVSFPKRMCVLMFHFQEWAEFRTAFIESDNPGER